MYYVVECWQPNLISPFIGNGYESEAASQQVLFVWNNGCSEQSERSPECKHTSKVYFQTYEKYSTEG